MPYEEAQASAKAKGIGIWSMENYATASGFNSEDALSNSASSSNSRSESSASSGSSSPSSSASSSSASSAAEGSEWF